jgi:hypothetical protein
MGAWLLAHDVARRTIRQTGLTRFIAACLLPGYVWLMFAGGLWLFGNFSAGRVYDAALHSVLLGFVFSMIFGHAPIILPAVLNLPITFHASFYAHLALLHASLVLRIIGDLAADPSLRMWAGLLNAIAILLFLSTRCALRRSGHRHRQPSSGECPPYPWASSLYWIIYRALCGGATGAVRSFFASPHSAVYSIYMTADHILFRHGTDVQVEVRGAFDLPGPYRLLNIGLICAIEPMQAAQPEARDLGWKLQWLAGVAFVALRGDVK